MNTDPDIALEALEEINIDLKWSMMLLRLNLKSMRVHGHNLNLTSQLRNQKLDLLTTGH